MPTITPSGGSRNGGPQHQMSERHSVPVSKQSNSVVTCARSWVGRHFNPGKPEQCAAFVRHVFSEAGVRVGEASRPSDASLVPAGSGFGPNLADSFAGGEVGELVEPGKHKAGDIVMYMNTYGSFKPGVITHVGIVAGPEEVIHRPTVSAPVALDRLQHAKIAEIRRPRGMGATGSGGGMAAKVFVHDGKACAIRGGHPVGRMEVRVEFGHGIKVYVDGREVHPVSMDLQIFY